MLSTEELEYAKSIDEPAIVKLVEFYEAVSSDPTEEFYASLCLTIKKISADLMILRGNDHGQIDELDLNILNREDKVFERIILLFKEADRIYAVGNKGKKEDVATPGKSSQPSTQLLV